MSRANPDTQDRAKLRDLIAINSSDDLAVLIMLVLITLIDILELAH
jgi:hypothetical protein